MPDWCKDKDEAAGTLAYQTDGPVPVTVSQKPRARTRRRRWGEHSGHILLPHPSSIFLLRQFCAVVAVLPPAFERIDVAESAGVHKVELDDIIAVVERCAWVWSERILMEGYESAVRRRGANARSGHGGSRGGGSN